MPHAEVTEDGGSSSTSRCLASPLPTAKAMAADTDVLAFLEAVLGPA
jgi:hypothetical protein